MHLAELQGHVAESRCLTEIGATRKGPFRQIQSLFGRMVRQFTLIILFIRLQSEMGNACLFGQIFMPFGRMVGDSPSLLGILHVQQRNEVRIGAAGPFGRNLCSFDLFAYFRHHGGFKFSVAFGKILICVQKVFKHMEIDIVVLKALKITTKQPKSKNKVKSHVIHIISI